MHYPSQPTRNASYIILDIMADLHYFDVYLIQVVVNNDLCCSPYGSVWPIDYQIDPFKPRESQNKVISLDLRQGNNGFPCSLLDVWVPR